MEIITKDHALFQMSSNERQKQLKSRILAKTISNYKKRRSQNSIFILIINEDEHYVLEKYRNEHKGYNTKINPDNWRITETIKLFVIKDPKKRKNYYEKEEIGGLHELTPNVENLEKTALNVFKKITHYQTYIEHIKRYEIFKKLYTFFSTPNPTEIPYYQRFNIGEDCKTFKITIYKKTQRDTFKIIKENSYLLPEILKKGFLLFEDYDRQSDERYKINTVITDGEKETPFPSIKNEYYEIFDWIIRKKYNQIIKTIRNEQRNNPDPEKYIFVQNITEKTEEYKNVKSNNYAYNNFNFIHRKPETTNYHHITELQKIVKSLEEVKDKNIEFLLEFIDKPILCYQKPITHYIKEKS